MLPNLHSENLWSQPPAKWVAQGRRLWEGSRFPPFALQNPKDFSIKLSILLCASFSNCPSLKNIILHFSASAPPSIMPTSIWMCQNFTASCPNFHFIATYCSIKINCTETKEFYYTGRTSCNCHKTVVRLLLEKKKKTRHTQPSKQPKKIFSNK